MTGDGRRQPRQSAFEFETTCRAHFSFLSWPWALFVIFHMAVRTFHFFHMAMRIILYLSYDRAQYFVFLPTDIISSEKLRKLRKIKPFGRRKASKKIWHILLIFPVLGKMTHMAMRTFFFFHIAVSTIFTIYFISYSQSLVFVQWLLIRQRGCCKVYDFKGDGKYKGCPITEIWFCLHLSSLQLCN